MKNVLIISFVIVCIIQWIVPAKMIVNSERILEDGSEYIFGISAVRPGQYEKGEYITIRYQELFFEVDSASDWTRRQAVFITLGKDENGLGLVTSVLNHKPEGNVDFLKAHISSLKYRGNKKMLYFRIPDNIYYLNPSQLQSLAPTDDQDNLVREIPMKAVLAIKNGRGLIKDVIPAEVTEE